MNGNTESIINITDFVKNVIEYNVKEEHIIFFFMGFNSSWSFAF